MNLFCRNMLTHRWTTAGTQQKKITAFSGKECAIVTGDTSPGERAEILTRFKGEFVPADLFGTPKPQLKFPANVNALTTGFDAHTNTYFAVSAMLPGLNGNVPLTHLRYHPE